jgi:hypothetical protein
MPTCKQKQRISRSSRTLHMVQYPSCSCRGTHDKCRNHHGFLTSKPGRPAGDHLPRDAPAARHAITRGSFHLIPKINIRISTDPAVCHGEQFRPENTHICVRARAFKRVYQHPQPADNHETSTLITPSHTWTAAVVCCRQRPPPPPPPPPHFVYVCCCCCCCRRRPNRGQPPPYP